MSAATQRRLRRRGRRRRPRRRGGGRDGTLIYFQNTGTATAPAFAEQTGAANPFDGIDVGASSTPASPTWTATATSTPRGGRRHADYFRNTGTASAPAFAQQTGAANPFGGVDVGDSAPTFADLDGDGDLDAFVGESDGTLSNFRTSAPQSRRLRRADRRRQPVRRRQCGRKRAPSFADVDGDGDLDVVVGEADGTLDFFGNTGAGSEFTVNVTAQGEVPVVANPIPDQARPPTPSGPSSCRQRFTDGRRRARLYGDARQRRPAPRTGSRSIRTRRTFTGTPPRNFARPDRPDADGERRRR